MYNWHLWTPQQQMASITPKARRLNKQKKFSLWILDNRFNQQSWLIFQWFIGQTYDAFQNNNRASIYPAHQAMKPSRPRIDPKQFELALKRSKLSEEELAMIEFIRYMGVFNELSLRHGLSLPSKPPAVYVLGKLIAKKQKVQCTIWCVWCL